MNRNLNPEEFGLGPLADNTLRGEVAFPAPGVFPDDEGWDAMPDEVLDPARLRPTQNEVYPDTVSRYANSAEDRETGALRAAPIRVMRQEGEDYIIDGHHRASAAAYNLAQVRGRVWNRPPRN